MAEKFFWMWAETTFLLWVGSIIGYVIGWRRGLRAPK